MCMDYLNNRVESYESSLASKPSMMRNKAFLAFSFGKSALMLIEKNEMGQKAQRSNDTSMFHF